MIAIWSLLALQMEPAVFQHPCMHFWQWCGTSDLLVAWINTWVHVIWGEMTLSWLCLCLWLCRTSVMGCRGVKNVWSGKFFSSPSGNSETHTVQHTNTHKYTHVHTNTRPKVHFYMVREHRHYLTHPLKKPHAHDRVSRPHNKDSHTDLLTHIHRKTHTVHKIYTFQNTYTVMNTPTKSKKQTCLRTYTHQKLNVPPHYRTCRQSQKCM